VIVAIEILRGRTQFLRDLPGFRNAHGKDLVRASACLRRNKALQQQHEQPRKTKDHKQATRKKRSLQRSIQKAAQDNSTTKKFDTKLLPPLLRLIDILILAAE